MRVQIDAIALGMSNTYVIRDQGAIIVDGGDTKKTNEFMKGIERISLKPEEIKLIVITHGQDRSFWLPFPAVRTSYL